jgi:hypothetical protein
MTLPPGAAGVFKSATIRATAATLMGARNSSPRSVPFRRWGRSPSSPECPWTLQNGAWMRSVCWASSEAGRYTGVPSGSGAVWLDCNGFHTGNAGNAGMKAPDWRAVRAAGANRPSAVRRHMVRELRQRPPVGEWRVFRRFGGSGKPLPTGCPALPQKPPTGASLGVGRYLAPGGANPR